jgi:hypothetical protein
MNAPAVVDLRAASKPQPVTKPVPVATPALPFAVGDPVPEGCFAWSARQSAFACTLGIWSVGVGMTERAIQFIALDSNADVPADLAIAD